MTPEDIERMAKVLWDALQSHRCKTWNKAKRFNYTHKPKPWDSQRVDYEAKEFRAMARAALTPALTEDRR